MPIALGYSRTREGVGGVRNYLEAISRHSNFGIGVFPSNEMCQWASKHNKWGELKRVLCDLPLDNFRILHSNVDPDFIAACRSANKAGVPWVHTYHTLYFPDHWEGTKLVPWQEKINRSLIKEASQADVRISISPWLHKYLKDNHGIETLIIPNGVDVQKCLSADPITANENYCGIGSYVLYSGSLAEVKNARLFIDLAARFPTLTFVMIGKSLVVSEVEPHYGKTLPGNLRLIGPVSHPEALGFTRSAMAFVVTSHSEGLPTALLEAMAMGKNVVAPNSFGCRDLIEHGKDGFLFEPGSLDSLERQLEAALTDTEIGKIACQTVRKQYDWAQVAKRIDHIYADLMR